MKTSSNTPLYRLGQVLDAYLKRGDIHPRLQEQRAVGCWERAVGRPIAEATQAVRVRNRVLQVKVANPVWAQELQFHKALIIEKLNALVGEPVVRELWFFVGEREPALSPAAAKEERRNPARPLSGEDRARIEREVSGLRDPEMRDALLRLFSRALREEKARGGR